MPVFRSMVLRSVYGLIPVLCAGRKGADHVFEWDAGLYTRFLKERTRPAVDLAARIALDAPRSAIDIGCGPGNSTQVLAERFPGACVTGADNSEAMLAKARKDRPRFRYLLLDAQRDLTSHAERYDIVFSNACIQWIPDHRKLIPEMMGLLNAGGVLAVQIPVNYDEPIHRIMRSVAAKEEWRSRFGADPGMRDILSEEEYFDLLSGLTDDFELWRTVYMHRMPSHESILDWYRGTGLRPYLERLDPGEAAEFEREVLSSVREAYPRRANGEILFRFPRLFFTARKARADQKECRR